MPTYLPTRPMEWRTQPDIYCKTSEDMYLHSCLLDIINAPHHKARQTPHNRLYGIIDNLPWFQKIKSIAKRDKCFAEALDNLWLWLFGKNKDGHYRIDTFEPRSREVGLTNSFLAFIRNKFKWLLQDVYKKAKKPVPLSLDSLLGGGEENGTPNTKAMQAILEHNDPFDFLAEAEDSDLKKAFLRYCANQPKSLNVAYGQRRTQEKGFTCNAWLQRTAFGNPPMIQAELATEFDLSVDTITAHVQLFYQLIKEEYQQWFREIPRAI
jgi:hypothetical protein